jgi:hypothetical protein
VRISRGSPENAVYCRLLGGAEGIRTAGPLCAPYIQRRLVTREISTRSFHIKPHREVFFDSIYRYGRAENELILNCLLGGATGLLGGWDRRFESPLLQQRGTANHRSDPSMTVDRERSRFDSFRDCAVDAEIGPVAEITATRLPAVTSNCAPLQ